VKDQLRKVFGALVQQRLLESCPPCTLPRLKTPVRRPTGAGSPPPGLPSEHPVFRGTARLWSLHLPAERAGPTTAFHC
jgi:hypothetical protein